MSESDLIASDYSVKSNDDPYVEWHRRKDPSKLFWGGGTWWYSYNRCLVSASPKPQPITLTLSEATNLLDMSGALLLRYFSETSTKPTEFWYTACNEYDFNTVSGSTRSKIRRAYKNCRLERTNASWLAINGYECHSSAFVRYRNASCEPRSVFEYQLMESLGGPFEFWAIFVGKELAGYAKCVVGKDYVATVVVKFHPSYLSLYTAYGLWDTLLKHYVVAAGKFVVNGFRSLVHDTNVHDFLEKFGFRRMYCDLHIVYSEPLGSCVQVLYPLRAIMTHLSGSLGKAINGILTQEKIRRSFS